MSVDGEERVRAPHGEREECERVGRDGKTRSQDWNPRPLQYSPPSEETNDTCDEDEQCD